LPLFSDFPALADQPELNKLNIQVADW